MEMDVETLKERLRKYKKEDIVITEHGEIQAFVRNINLEEVKNNIIKPDKLVYAEEEKAKKVGEKKYNCYFAYSKSFCHRYTLTVNRKVIIVTIIKINRDWQKIIDGK